MFLSEIKKKYVYLVENLLERFFLFKILRNCIKDINILKRYFLIVYNKL